MTAAAARRVERAEMGVFEKPKAKGRDVGLYLPEETLAKLDALMKAEKARSRNWLLTRLIDLSLELVPRLTPLSAEVKAFAEAEGCGETEALARLVERGLRAKK